MPDEQPDHIASLDQARAGLADFAKLVASYYKALVGEDVPMEVATQLAVNYQSLIFMSTLQQQSEESDG